MIEIRNLTKSKIPTKTLVRIGEAVLKKEKRASGDLSIVLLGEKRMKELNRMYRGKNEVTNVLSFPMKELGLGEIILCPAKIRKDAKKYGIMFTVELYRVFIHGLLHLTGYDHEKEADFRRMSQKEEQYLLLVS